MFRSKAPASDNRSTVQEIPASTRILVIGAGYAGLLFTMRLAGKVAGQHVQITLVNESDTFTERPRMHQFATHQVVQWRSLRQMLRPTQVQFIQGRVTSIDPAHHEIVIMHQQYTEHLGYDYLVYALGSETDRQTVPGVAEHAYTLAPRGPLSAAALRDTLPSIAARGGQVVVAGGGATGIETAAEVASAYPHIKVRLVTREPVALFLNKSVGSSIRRRLLRLGVEIIDQVTVTAVRAHSVVTDQGDEFACDLCIWTGGFVAPPLAKEAGVAVNERNQIVVDPFLRSISHPEIYAIGDAADPREDPGAHVRMSAVTAAIMGAYGADSLSAVLHGKASRPFGFAYLGQGIALGRHNAIGFNNYPDDRPIPPYFTGWLGYQIREAFVRYLAAAPRFERRWPGLFVWPGKHRYEAAQRQQQAKAKNNSKHLGDHRPRFQTSPDTQKQLLTGFLQAIQTGEMTPLMEMLTEEVTMWTDGGGKVKGAATHPITGREAVARFSLAASKRFLPEGARVELAEVNGQPGLIIRVGERAYRVMTIEVEAQQIRTIRIIANPEKLARV